jgi:ketosteroid isomerase-like protein
MGIDANKELVREYWRQINEKQSSEVLELCSDDFVFWFPGTDGGFQTMEQARESFDSIFQIFPTGLVFTLYEMTAEGDRVALEAESHGVHKSGRKYNNHYHFLFRVRDGKIAEIREYGDTQHARDVLEG